MTNKNLQKFDLALANSRGSILVVVSDTLEIPYFVDGCGTGAAIIPLDLQNPKEWLATFPARICFDILNNNYLLQSEASLERFELSEGNHWIGFDQATSRLRAILGLLKQSGGEALLKEIK